MLALTFMHSLVVCILLIADALIIVSANQKRHISVCQFPQSGCAAFYEKQGSFESYRQCLNYCTFRTDAYANKIKGYECYDYQTPCKPLVYYGSIPTGKHFPKWVKCLQVCDHLSGDTGTASVEHSICNKNKANCVDFGNPGSTLEVFLGCYVRCHQNKKGRRTKIWQMQVCMSHGDNCIPARYFGEPDQNAAFNKLKVCYSDCKAKLDANAREIEGYECVYYGTPCKALDFNNTISSGKNFLQRKKCLQVCDHLSGETGSAPVEHSICDENKANCVDFGNPGRTLEVFLGCYVRCHRLQKGKRTKIWRMQVCKSHGDKCIPARYFGEPDQNVAFNALKVCYSDCKEELVSANQEHYISVCKFPQSECAAFFAKQGSFEPFRQCLKHCKLRTDSNAKEIEGYECGESQATCTPLVYYDSMPTGEHFLEWVKCLQICNHLSGDTGAAPVKHSICDENKANCVDFENSGTTLEVFLSCYVHCQLHKQEEQTIISQMQVCMAHGNNCIPARYFGEPDQNAAFNKLKVCYSDCKEELATKRTRSVSANQKCFISICKVPKSNCVAFQTKNGSFEPYRQCLKYCTFKTDNNAKEIEAYECVDYGTSCNSITYYDSTPTGKNFLQWVKCLQVCDHLSGDTGTAPVEHSICDETKSNCVDFGNPGSTLEVFLGCYIRCHQHKKVCTSHGDNCIPDRYLGEPDQKAAFYELKVCYTVCKEELGAIRCKLALPGEPAI